MKLVILGFTGDLTRRLLMPAIVRLFAHGEMREVEVLGFGAEPWSNEEALEQVEAFLKTL